MEEKKDSQPARQDEVVVPMPDRIVDGVNLTGVDRIMNKHENPRPASGVAAPLPESLPEEQVGQPQTTLPSPKLNGTK